NFKMDHFIGNWWSANDSDVVPAAYGAKCYKGATFHAPGTSLKVFQEVVKNVYDKGKGAGKTEEMGEPLYNRGIVNAMFAVEAIRTAMAQYGNKPMTGEQVRWGVEHLNLTDKRVEELGMKGVTHPVKVSCEDHESSGMIVCRMWAAPRPGTSPRARPSSRPRACIIAIPTGSSGAASCR